MLYRLSSSYLLRSSIRTGSFGYIPISLPESFIGIEKETGFESANLGCTVDETLIIQFLTHPSDTPGLNDSVWTSVSLRSLRFGVDARGFRLPTIAASIAEGSSIFSITEETSSLFVILRKVTIRSENGR